MMMQEEQLARLREAFAHPCVYSWLGYGAPLFIGFGDSLMPAPPDPLAPDCHSLVNAY